MDDELRELEQAGQKAVSAVSKVTNYTEQMLQTLLNASGKTLGFAGKQVKKANDIERERHRAKKAEKGSEAKVSDKISGSKVIWRASTLPASVPTFAILQTRTECLCRLSPIFLTVN